MKDIRLKRDELVTHRMTWMAAYKNSERITTAGNVDVGSLIVVHCADEEGINEPHECYVPFVIVGHSTAHVRVATLVDNPCGIAQGTTLKRSELCAVLR